MCLTFENDSPKTEPGKSYTFQICLGKLQQPAISYPYAINQLTCGINFRPSLNFANKKDQLILDADSEFSWYGAQQWFENTKMCPDGNFPIGKLILDIQYTPSSGV